MSHFICPLLHSIYLSVVVIHASAISLVLLLTVIYIFLIWLLGNDKIDFDEFLLLVKKYEKPLSEEQEIREMFNAIDNDRNGFIDLDELKATFTKLGVPLSDKDVGDMMKEAGVEGNRIFYEGELSRLLQLYNK